jgi:RNA polymerase sigma-70 factor, ECF subfamily
VTSGTGIITVRDRESTAGQRYPHRKDDMPQLRIRDRREPAGRLPPVVNGRRARPADDPKEELAVVLMRQVRDGDDDALHRLVAMYWERVVSHAFRLTGSRDTAEDVAQEAFLRLWCERRSWTPSGTVRGYLARITRNVGLNHIRSAESRVRRESRFALEEERSSPTPEEAFRRSELRARMGAAIRSLPPKRREVFVRARLHQSSYGEIARAMDISPQTVANQLSRATAQVRRAFQGSS